MKVYELLELAKPIMQTLSCIGVSPKDVVHIDMYKEYSRLKADGEKITYIEATLSDKYQITERRIRQIIKSLNMSV